MAQGFLTVGNGPVRICTQAFGQTGDPAIVLVMGATASMMWWPDRLCETLDAAGRYVVRFDHRDTGASTTGAPGQVDYDVADLADDLLAVLDGHGIERAHLVGMSLGGYVSQMVALRDPGRVRRLTVIAAEPLGGEAVEAPGIDQALMDHFGAMADLDWSNDGSVRAFLMRIAELSSSRGRGLDMAIATERVDREMARAGNIAAMFNHSMLAGETGSLDLRDIAVPTLVIHGAHDPVLPLARGEAIARQVRGARLVVLGEAGHELHGDDLDTIAAAILDHDGP